MSAQHSSRVETWRLFAKHSLSYCEALTDMCRSLLPCPSHWHCLLVETGLSSILLIHLCCLVLLQVAATFFGSFMLNEFLVERWVLVCLSPELLADYFVVYIYVEHASLWQTYHSHVIAECHIVNTDGRTDGWTDRRTLRLAVKRIRCITVYAS